MEIKKSVNFGFILALASVVAFIASLAVPSNPEAFIDIAGFFYMMIFWAPLSIAAFAFGIISLSKMKKEGVKNKSFKVKAIISIILGSPLVLFPVIAPIVGIFSLLF